MPDTATCLALATLIVASAQLPSKEKFEGGLTEVEARMKLRHWKSARESLQKLLEANQGQDYVRAKLGVIADDLKRCAFWIGRKEPNPKDLVHGELLSFQRTTDTIKLRYDIDAPEKVVLAPRLKTIELPDAQGVTTEESNSKDVSQDAFADFYVRNGLSIHPLQFSGPYSVEVEGYIDDSGRLWAPVLVAFVERDVWFSACLGHPSVYEGQIVRWIPATFRHGQGGQIETLESRDLSFLGRAKRFTITLSVGESQITVTVDGQRVFSAQKPPKRFGWFGFVDDEDIYRIVMSGRSHGAWIDSLIDASLQTDWSAFEARYDPDADLPAWLRSTPVSAAADTTAAPRDDPLAFLPPEIRSCLSDEHTQRLADYLSKKDIRGGLEYFKSLEENRIDSGASSYVQSMLSWMLGDYAGALALNEVVCVRQPDLMRARVIHVQLLERLRRRPEAALEARKLITQFPTRPEPYEALAELLLHDRRPEDANAVIEEGLAARVDPKSLDDMSSKLVRALNGPQWRKQARYDSKHYEVLSDMDQDTCRLVSATLEEAHQYYCRHFARPPKEAPKRFKTFVFSGRRGYYAYAEDLLDDEHRNSAGMYIPMLQQLVVWNLPDRNSMIDTVRHEGFHQFLHRFIDHPPVWFNEGLAQYYENLRKEKGAWVEGNVHPEHVELMTERDYRWIPTGDVLHLPPERFYRGRVDAHYAQSWLIVHFLMTTGEANRARLDRLFQLLVDGVEPSAAEKQVFDDIGLNALDRTVQTHLRQL